MIRDLKLWKSNHQKLKPVIAGAPVLKEIETLSEDLSRIAGIGLEAVEFILAGKKVGPRWTAESKKVLKAAKEPRGHAELMVVTAIEKLVGALLP